MGNSLRFLYGHCCKPTTGGGSASPGGHHALSASAVGVNALAEDLRHFDITSQVPEGLSKHVNSSKKAQANWYRKLVAAWREAKRPPTTAEEAARLVLLTLKDHQKQDVQGLLAFYSLPGVPTTMPDQSVIFELQTLPVDRKAVADGDTLTVYVNTKDPQESECIPRQVKLDFQERSNERAKRNYNKADALHNNIINSGYRVLKSENGGEILARKYKIQLRGVDAPKYELPYGKEAKIELTKLVEGKCLRVLVYEEDCYGRYVADVYSNGVFVQKEMLRGGCAKHYIAFDKRPQLASWEKEAKAKRLGLWALPNMRR